MSHPSDPDVEGAVHVVPLALYEGALLASLTSSTPLRSAQFG